MDKKGSLRLLLVFFFGDKMLLLVGSLIQLGYNYHNLFSTLLLMLVVELKQQNCNKLAHFILVEIIR